MSSQSRSSRRSTVDKSVLKWTTFLYLRSLLPSYATELPTNIWNGGHGGFLSVTANHSGVSVTLPQQAIIDAGGGPLDTLVKGFSTVGRRKSAATSSISNIPMKR